MSATVQCLLGDVPLLLEAGVSALRLVPQVCDMVAMAGLFRAVATGGLAPAEAMVAARAIYPAEYSNGFIHALPGHLLHHARHA